MRHNGNGFIRQKMFKKRIMNVLIQLKHDAKEDIAELVNRAVGVGLVFVFEAFGQRV